jgi:hypothetical protein
MGFLGHTIAKRASGNKPNLNTIKVEGLAPYNYKGQLWNELHSAVAG